MAGIFKRSRTNFGGAFPAQFGMLTSTVGLTGILMQSLNATFNQQTSKIYEIGRAGEVRNFYHVGGPSAGSLGVQHVMGPAMAFTAYYEKFSDLCEVGTNTIALKLDKRMCAQSTKSRLNGSIGGVSAGAAIASNGQLGITAKFCLMNGVGFSTNAQNLVVQENSALEFSDLDYEEG